MNSNVSRDIEVCNKTITLLNQISNDNLTVDNINERNLHLLCDYLENRDSEIDYSELQKIDFDKIMMKFENISPNSNSLESIQRSFTKKMASLILLSTHTEDIKNDIRKKNGTQVSNSISNNVIQKANKNTDIGFGN